MLSIQLQSSLHLPVGKGATIRYPGVGAGKNFEINKFFLKNGKKNICTQAPCIYSVTENVKKIFSCHLDVK